MQRPKNQIRKESAKSAGKVLLGFSAIATLACSSLAPVPHDPWVEDRTLELSAERLELEVRPDVVAVDARFVFTPRSEGREHAMDFAIAEPGGPPREFSAELVSRDGSVTPLAVSAGSGSALPVSGIGETRSFHLPTGSFAPGAWLRVRYSQAADTRFDYMLRSGAYWAGPIGVLDVVLRDPEQRVLGATVENRTADRREGNELRWRFVDLEPREAIKLRLRRTRPD